jgi:hypothetical protein
VKLISICLITLAAMGTALCQSQVTPVVAKQRTVRDVWDPQGNFLRHTETLAVYLRNSAGSTITQEYSLAGDKMVIRSAQLEDYSRHKIYEVNYERHEAVELADLNHGPHPEYLASTKTSLGQETVNGFPCIIHTIYMMMKDGIERPIGKTYDSGEYGLNIKSDEMIETSGGARTHKVVELYDIQFIEPDPKEFALENFSFPEKQPAACRKPTAPVVAEPLN